MIEGDAVRLRVRFRDLEPADLPDLAWSGGPVHRRALAQEWRDSRDGSVAVVVGTLDNGRAVALGVADFGRDVDAGRLRTLIVHDLLQSLGVGTKMIAALEERVGERGRPWARLTVELDNPRAQRLYARLGYSVVGPVTERWPSESGGLHTASCLLMARRLT